MDIKKISAGLTTAGLMLAMSAAPVFASTTVLVGGNGAFSTNIVKLKSGCSTTLVQGNETVALTEVNSVASTGGNSASMNTGSGVTVSSGAATSNVTVSVTGGDNTASGDNCCECQSGDVEIAIVDNGVKSYNKVKRTAPVSVTKVQGTKTAAMTGVASKAKTGKNKADKNTGGVVSVTTDDSESTVEVTVEGGSNSVNP